MADQEETNIAEPLELTPEDIQSGIEDRSEKDKGLTKSSPEYIKENEPANSERSGQSEEDASSTADGGPGQAKEEGTEEAEASSPPSETPEVETSDKEADFVTDEEYFEMLNKHIGIEGISINNDEQIIETIKTLATRDPLAGLSDFTKTVIKAELAGQDLKELVKVLALDEPEKLSERDLLWQRFVRNNKDVVTEDPKFAQMKFEREQESKYGVLSEDFTEGDFDTPAEYQKYLKEKQLAEGERNFEISSERKAIAAEREKLVKGLPEPNFKQDQLYAGVFKSEEEAAHAAEKFQQASTEFLDNFESIRIPIDDKGTVANIVHDENAKASFEKWLKSPGEFLAHIGVDAERGDVDMEKFGAHVAMTATMTMAGDKSIGAIIKRLSLEQANKETVKGELENVRDKDTPSGSQNVNESEELEAARLIRDQQTR